MFVTEGALYANTGWVLSVADPATFTINEDDISVIQFSGAGSYTAGTNLSLNGTQFNLDANITLTSVTATTVTATDFNSTSDVTLKENVSSLNNVLETINSINPVEFTWKDTGNKAYGVIAQEIENVLPEIVSQDENGIKSVNYIQIIAFLVKAVQEQQKEIELIKSKI
jgi:hypothetical protein